MRSNTSPRVEKRFARDLDNNENVKVFVKLPGWFRIDTPIGPYNPDWAFVTEREENLYFVRGDQEHAGLRGTPDEGEPEDCLWPQALRRTRRRLRCGDIAFRGKHVMADIRFDEGKRFAENCEAFLEAIKADNPEMATILRDNWDALVAGVQEGARDLKARGEFNSAVASALDSLVKPDELKGGA